ncbi:efflux RND transporter periplasmic adaptor subunit [Pedosphaera parvula]|uniref:Efflux transporter, RND family, MFP subunit n=1 Tax=Pedosphaera parvula (strain Ellin514) TaxID=320771 RepID=B9XRM2_PEDPL|nr:efflux RND transporter periplasmic adaptor subunit [Pedosphaera parvula]EEF57493.1 efflux transporter, RND family, MFP subunit [Pedosphaera parvula Ellin514]
MPEDKLNAGNLSPQPTSSAQRKPGHSRVWFLVAIAVILGVGAFFFFRHRAGRSKPKPPPVAVAVTTTTVTNGDIGVYVSALGSVTPLNTVIVGSQATGPLIRVDYTEGQMVNKGDLLAEIDPRPFEAQVTAAEGQYERDKAVLEGARIDLARFEAAYSSNAIPRQQLEDQRAVVHQNEGTVKFDQGQLESAKVLLSYCRIISPISGRIGLRLVDPGNIILATSSNTLAVITQLQPITVIFSVAEDYLPQILEHLQPGRSMAVDVYDRVRQRKIATGKLLALDNQIEIVTGTVRLRAIFPNEDNGLFPNQFVNARLLIDVERGVALVPSIAIQLNPQGSFVYFVKPDQTVTMRTITVGTTDGNVTAVKGVEPGEVIVLDNFNRLQEGTKITPRGQPAQPAPANQKEGGQ